MLYLALFLGHALALSANSADDEVLWNKFSLAIGDAKLRRAFSNPDHLAQAIAMEPPESLKFDCALTYQFGKEICMAFICYCLYCLF